MAEDNIFALSLKCDRVKPVLDDEGKALLNNLTTALGPGKKSAKQEKTWYADKVYLSLRSVAKLTGNSVEDVACCWHLSIDENTLKNYNYVTPQIPLKGTSLQSRLSDYARRSGHDSV